MARSKSGKRIRKSRLRVKANWVVWLEFTFWMTLMLGALAGSVLTSMFIGG